MNSQRLIAFFQQIECPARKRFRASALIACFIVAEHFDKHGKGISMGSLAEAIGVSPAATTGIVQLTLMELGLVHAYKMSGNRKTILVSPTEKLESALALIS